MLVLDQVYIGASSIVSKATMILALLTDSTGIHDLLKIEIQI
jgi:hypothetical protein